VGGRFAAVCFLEEADPFDRPVGEEGLPDDPFSRDGSPEAAVVALPTIVAHHKKVIWRNFERRRKRALADGSAGPCEGLLLDLAVYHGMAVANGNGIPWKRHYSLDEIDIGALLGRARTRLTGFGAGHPAFALATAHGTRGGMKDHDVPTAGVGEPVVDAIHEHALADGERWLHGGAGNTVGLNEKCLDQERQPEGRRDDQHQLEKCSVTLVPQVPERAKQR